jgi:cyclopropane fatty-acyl-phospholipid synthase-like methyltransferase
MTRPACAADEYESLYRDFDSEIMRRIRAEAYGEDIGQHSWSGADELREDSRRLGLGPKRRLLDLGCGPCGPLTFLIAYSGCSGVGLDQSAAAVKEGHARAATLNVGARFSARIADLNAPLPSDLGSFDAVLAIDVVLHIRDREALFREVATILAPGGRFLFTDAGVVTGALSDDEIRRRSAYGYTQFVPEGWNEARLTAVGLRVIERENRTSSVVRNARGRARALRTHTHEIRSCSGIARLERQFDYLSTAEATAERGALSRFMYLAEALGRCAD